MRRLYIRIAAGVIFAVVVGWAAAALSLAQLRGQMTLEPPNYLAGNGLLWIAAQFDGLPESLWNERLAEVRRYVRLPLAIASGADVPRHMLGSLSANKPVFVPAEIGPIDLLSAPQGLTLSRGGSTSAPTTSAAPAAFRRSLDLRGGIDSNGIGRSRNSSRPPATKPAERDQQINSTGPCGLTRTPRAR